MLVLDLLGRSVVLLLTLLTATTETEHQVEGRLLLDVIVAQSAAILQLLAGEDKTLLIRGNTFTDIREDGETEEHKNTSGGTSGATLRNQKGNSPSLS